MVEGTCLENKRPFTRSGSSNPPASAKKENPKGFFFLRGERVTCVTLVGDSKDFSFSGLPERKVPGYVIAESYLSLPFT